MIIKKNIKQQSKSTFIGFHNSYTNYDSYTCKRTQVSMDKPHYLKFALLEKSKLVMYKRSHDTLQPFLDKKNRITLYRL